MEDYSLQVADVVVVGIVAISALWALMRGFVREVLGVGSWLLALFCALYGYGSMMNMFKGIGNELMRHVVAFGVIFIGVLTTSLIITERIADRVDDGALNQLDQALGLAFGLLRGGVIVCLLYLIIASFSDDKQDLPEWVQQASTLPMVDGGAQMLVSLLPKELERDAEETTNMDDDLPEEEEKDDRKDRSRLSETLRRLNSPRPEREYSKERNEKPTRDDKDRESMDDLIDSIQ
jgi:membrane protein required for colicin V production